MADFIADWTPFTFDTTVKFEELEWIVHCDGAWDTASIGVSAILTQPSGSRLWYAARLEFLSMNNIAEYEAMLLGLWKLRALRIRRCIIKSDSQVIVGHIEKNFVAKEPKLVRYLVAIRRMEKHFTGFSLHHIPRNENAEADELAKAAA